MTKDNLVLQGLGIMKKFNLKKLSVKDGTRLEKAFKKAGWTCIPYFSPGSTGPFERGYVIYSLADNGEEVSFNPIVNYSPKNTTFRIVKK